MAEKSYDSSKQCKRRSYNDGFTMLGGRATLGDCQPEGLNDWQEQF